MASQSGSSRVRQAAIMDVWVAVNGPCTSIANSTLRTSEVSALTDLVRSAVSCSRATLKTLVATRGFWVCRTVREGGLAAGVPDAHRSQLPLVVLMWGLLARASWAGSPLHVT